MNALIGANLDELDQLAAAFTRAAHALDGVRAQVERQISVPWAGRDADGFRQAWQGQHRPKLQTAIDGLNEASRQVAVQRNEQAQASGAGASAGGGSSMGGATPGSPSFHDFVTSVAPVAIPVGVAGSAASIVATIADIPHAAAGKAVNGFGYAVDGAIVADDLARGHLAAGARDAVLLTADVVADTAKARGGWAGYLLGVDIQIGAEIVRALTKVDISRQGWHQVISASPTEWKQAFSEVPGESWPTFLKIATR